MLMPLIAFPIELAIQQPGLPRYTFGGKLVGAVVCTAVVMLFWHAGRLRAEASPAGVTVFGFMRKIHLPWSVVDGFALRGSLRVLTKDGRAIAIPGFMAAAAQAAAGNRPGRKALATLARYRESAVSGPKPAVRTRYKPYLNLWVLGSAFVYFLIIAVV